MDDASPPSERWIDAHSVTCAICGALADERETLNLYDREQSRLEGEAHLDCWEDHECLEDGLFAPDPNPDVEADIDPAAETISLPVVCKVCGRSLRLCYDFATVYDPQSDTFHLLSSTQIETHTQHLRGIVQKLVNADKVDPEEAQYLRDDITALRDRLAHHASDE